MYTNTFLKTVACLGQKLWSRKSKHRFPKQCPNAFTTKPNYSSCGSLI